MFRAWKRKSNVSTSAAAAATTETTVSAADESDFSESMAAQSRNRLRTLSNAPAIGDEEDASDPMASALARRSSRSGSSAAALIGSGSTRVSHASRSGTFAPPMASIGESDGGGGGGGGGETSTRVGRSESLTNHRPQRKIQRSVSTVANLVASNQRARDDECAQCHGQAADAVNRPCGHRLLCMECAVSFREKDAKQRCNVCQQPSKLELAVAKEPELVCVVCCESWGPRAMFVPGDCGHMLCVGCTTQVARDAHGDRTRITTEGVRCGYSGCKTRLDRNVVRTLVNLGNRTLPDPRATVGNPPELIAPLSEEELATIERFMDEESVPVENRAWCPEPACGKLLNLPRTEEPSALACPWCEEGLCSKCALPWAKHTGGGEGGSDKGEGEGAGSNSKVCPSASDVRASGDASAILIKATSKACPSCGHYSSHFLGHACHHISPDTNGCPQCHTHYCYACLATASQNTSERGAPERCACPSHFWSEFCSTVDVVENLVYEPYPHDKRCGCPVCPYCRPGVPCEQCPGSCPVCKNEVAPGPLELLAAGSSPLKPLVLKTFACLHPSALCKSPSHNDHAQGPAAEAHSPLANDLVTGEVVAGNSQTKEGTDTEEEGEELWLKMFVRGAGDVFLPLVDPVSGERLLEPFESVEVREGDLVRIRPVSEEEALRSMDGFGGWSSGMADQLGTFALVYEVLGDSAPGRVHLQHAGTTLWVWASALVVRVKPGSFPLPLEPALPRCVALPWVGEPVQIESVNTESEDELAALHFLQDGFGGWDDSRKPLLGFKGAVEQVWRDGTVQVGGRRWAVELLTRLDPAFQPPLLPPRFEVGAAVRVKDVGCGEAARLQQEAGVAWWAPSMEMILGLHGVVEDVSASATDGGGDTQVVTVRGEKWSDELVEHARGGGLSNPRGGLVTGEVVRIRGVSTFMAKALQGSKWDDGMQVFLGRCGTVDCLFDSGNVQVMGKVWDPELVQRAEPLTNDQGNEVFFGNAGDGAVYCGVGGCVPVGEKKPEDEEEEEPEPCESCFRWQVGTPEHASRLGHRGSWLTAAVTRRADGFVCSAQCAHGPQDLNLPHWSCCADLSEAFKCSAGVKHKWHGHRVNEMTAINCYVYPEDVDSQLSSSGSATLFGNVLNVDGVKNPGSLVVLSPCQGSIDSGLEAGDSVIRCDGVSVDGMPGSEFLSLLHHTFQSKGSALIGVLGARGNNKKLKAVAQQQAGGIAENSVVIVTDREKVIEFDAPSARQLQVDTFESYVNPSLPLQDGAVAKVLGRLPNGLCAVELSNKGGKRVDLIHTDGVRFVSTNFGALEDRDLPTLVTYLGYDGSHPVYKVQLHNGDGTTHSVVKRFRAFRALNEKVSDKSSKAKQQTTPAKLANPFPASSLKSKFSLIGGLMSKAELHERGRMLWRWLSELRWLGRRELSLVGWEVQAALNAFLDRPSDKSIKAKAAEWSKEASEAPPNIFEPESGTQIAPVASELEGAERQQVLDAVSGFPQLTCFEKSFELGSGESEGELGFVISDNGPLRLPTVVNYNPSRVWPSTGDQIVAVNDSFITVGVDPPSDQAIHKIFVSGGGDGGGGAAASAAPNKVKITFGYYRGGWQCAGCAAPGGCRGRQGGGSRHLCVEGCEFDLCQSCMDAASTAPPLFCAGETLRLASSAAVAASSSSSSSSSGSEVTLSGPALQAALKALAGATEGVVVDGALGGTVLANGVRLNNAWLERLPESGGGSGGLPLDSTGLHPWHGTHPLTKQVAISSEGRSAEWKSWNCDGFFFPGGCRGGSRRVAFGTDPFWYCGCCEFMLCEACWRMGQLAPLDCEPGDVVKVREDATPILVESLHKFLGPTPDTVQAGGQGLLLAVDSSTGALDIQGVGAAVHPALVELVERSFKVGERVNVAKSAGVTAAVERLADDGSGDVILLGAKYPIDQLSKIVTHKDKSSPFKHPWHEHLLKRSTNLSEWHCDGRCAPGGCRGVYGGSAGGGAVGQCRFECADGCDFDLCEPCLDLGRFAPKLFSVGDAVRIQDVSDKGDSLEGSGGMAEAARLAQGFGEWSGESMGKLLGSTGLVTEVSGGAGAVKVCGKLWNPAMVEHLKADEAALVTSAAAAASPPPPPPTSNDVDDGDFAVAWAGCAFKVGDAVTVKNASAEEAKAVHGSLLFSAEDMSPFLGTRGTVTGFLVDGNLEAVQVHGKAWAPAMLALLEGGPEGSQEAGRRLEVGEQVVLSPGGAAKFPSLVVGGTLRPGQVGTVLADAKDDRPFRVQHGTLLSWYAEPCLERAPPLAERPAPPPRLQVGEHVVAVPGGGLPLGTLGTVTHDDKSTFPYRVEFQTTTSTTSTTLWSREAHVVRVWPVGCAVRVRAVPVVFAQLLMPGSSASLPPGGEALLGSVGEVEGLLPLSDDGTAAGSCCLVVGGVAWPPEMLEPPAGYPKPKEEAESAAETAAAADAPGEAVAAVAASSSEDFMSAWGITGGAASAASAAAGKDEEVVAVTIPSGWAPADFSLLSLMDKMGGVHVTKVEGKAAALGLEEGDVVVSLNGLPCRGRPFLEVFPQMVMLARLGLACEVGVARRKKEELTEEAFFEILRSGVASVELLEAHCPLHIVNYVRSDEFVAHSREAYHNLDADGSGVIEPAELLPVLRSFAEGAGMQLGNEERWAKTFLDIFDADGNGHLSLHEYVALLSYFVVSRAALDCGLDIGEVCAEGEYRLMLARKNLDNQLENVRKGMEAGGFKVAGLEKSCPKTVLADLKASTKQEFTALDRDGNGSLDATEFRTVLITLVKAPPWALTDAHVTTMMATFDLNKNGKISFAEFEKMYRTFFLIGMDMEAAKNKAAENS